MTRYDNPYEDEGDGIPDWDGERAERAAQARRWLRQVTMDQPTVLSGMLSDLELLAEPFFLGTDYDPDDSDIDQEGPF